MKNKEAVEQLKLTLDYCMRADPDAYNEIEAIQHAIKCVELQIPKMPKQQEWSPALCRNCGAELSIHKGDGYYEHMTNLSICHCGQKIKWEDDDDE